MQYELNIPVGPFTFCLRTDIELVYQNLLLIYKDFRKFEEGEVFRDFFASVTHASGIRRFYRAQCNFFFGDYQPFLPLPVEQGYAMMEWGMNWCIANHSNQYLVMHAAAIEKNGRTLILPAPPGSGKSTLCAAMVMQDWRLFSDELTLIKPDLFIAPLARPINLKNNSIDIIRNHFPEAVFSSVADDTAKGTVALLKPPTASVIQSHIEAAAGALVFPRYVAGSKATLTKIDALTAFPMLIENSFNYHNIGKEGFDIACKLLKSVDCYSFEYSMFDEANQMLSNLIAN